MDGDEVRRYLEEVAREPLLTHAQELEAARSAQQGDIAARKKLIRANLRLVVSIAKRYANQAIPLGELLEAGNAGLVKAADRFDTTKGYVLDVFDLVDTTGDHAAHRRRRPHR